MTTLATGGYSTRDASFTNYPAAAQWVGVVFMIAGALPFLLYVRAVRGDWSILRDRQSEVMLLILAVGVAVLTLWLHWHGDRPLDDAIRLAAFNATSIMTTTGFASDDFAVWGPLAVGVFFYLMFIGGCTGSTSGAIKVFRFRVLLIVLREHIQRRFMPHAMSAQRTYDGKPLSVDVVEGVMAFLAVYFLTVALGAVALGAFGLDWLTALSGAVQAIGNVGPGLGPIIGPAGNFASLPDGAKWILALRDAARPARAVHRAGPADPALLAVLSAAAGLSYGGSIAPLCSRRIASARPASSGLWVATSSAAEVSRTVATSVSNTAPAVSSSRLPVGSSASSTAGRLAIARAIATRCCSPPERRAGRWRLARADAERGQQLARARSRGVCRLWPASMCGSITFSSALNSGSRWWNW